MIAFHFPPYAASSGIQRTLRFVQHLPAFGWEPAVLTAQPRAYESTSDNLLGDIPPGLVIERAFALDTARHLSIRGRYPGLLARPDRWITWRFGAIRAGLRLVREWRPQVIWSTYPIATAHMIGAAVQQKTGLPWIADFRDPMAQVGYPEDPRVWRSFKRIEERAIANARFSVFTTPSAARMYRERYPDAAERITLVENGYDEESFAGLGAGREARELLIPGALTLLHSGVVYPSERDPTQLFAAIGRLAAAKTINPQRFRVRFRAPSHEELLRALAREHAIENFIEVMPAVSYRAALEEMMRADGLLVMQASNCNEQIPAKLYEYLRAGRPIVGLTDPRGDTAKVLREAGLDTIARLDSVDEIAALLSRFIAAAPKPQAPLLREDYVARSSRRCRAGALARLLEQAATGH